MDIAGAWKTLRGYYLVIFLIDISRRNAPETLYRIFRSHFRAKINGMLSPRSKVIAMTRNSIQSALCHNLSHSHIFPCQHFFTHFVEPGTNEVNLGWTDWNRSQQGEGSQPVFLHVQGLRSVSPRNINKIK